jgi:hypothetical protein
MSRREFEPRTVARPAQRRRRRGQRLLAHEELAPAAHVPEAERLIVGYTREPVTIGAEAERAGEAFVSTQAADDRATPGIDEVDELVLPGERQPAGRGIAGALHDPRGQGHVRLGRRGRLEKTHVGQHRHLLEIGRGQRADRRTADFHGWPERPRFAKQSEDFCAASGVVTLEAQLRAGEKRSAALLAGEALGDLRAAIFAGERALARDDDAGPQGDERREQGG